MQDIKLNGVFDNRETMRREAWINGQLAAQWLSTVCGTQTLGETAMEWERKALEAPWGYYPNPPKYTI